MSNPRLSQIGADKIPPPPPLPPPPENPSSKVSKYVLKLKTSSPDHFFPPNPPNATGSGEAPMGLYFFYGTLTDPSMVREILELERDPEFRPAYIKGVKCKLWGQYPALVDAPDCMVQGAVYHVESVAHGEKLAAYETNNYRAFSCHIHYSDGMQPKEELGYTFKYQGSPKDLSDGVFDLRTWLRSMGRHDAVEKLDSKTRLC